MLEWMYLEWFSLTCEIHFNVLHFIILSEMLVTSLNRLSIRDGLGPDRIYCMFVAIDIRRLHCVPNRRWLSSPTAINLYYLLLIIIVTHLFTYFYPFIISTEQPQSRSSAELGREAIGNCPINYINTFPSLV